MRPRWDLWEADCGVLVSLIPRGYCIASNIQPPTCSGSIARFLGRE